MSEVNIVRDASSHWIEVASAEDGANELFIFSPYITGSSVEEIFEAKRDKKLFVFTSLDVMSVVNKSLDTDILLNLIDRGATIWHHPNLHAKVIYSARFSVIGSQNFTRGGKSNLEASVRLELNETNINEMRAFIEEAKSEAVIISKDEIQNFKNNCELLKKEHQGIIDKINEINAAPKTAGDRKKNAERQILGALSNLIDEVNKNSRPIKPVKLVPKKWQSEWTTGVHGEYLTFQIKRKGQSLLYFPYKGKVERLDGTPLCIDANTLTPFWVQTNNTQISKFYCGRRYWFTSKKILEKADIRPPAVSGWSRSGYDLNGCEVVVNLHNPSESETNSNIKINMHAGDFYELNLELFFNGFEFIEQNKNEIINVSQQEEKPGEEYYIENWEMRQALVVSEIQNFIQNKGFIPPMFEQYFQTAARRYSNEVKETREQTETFGRVALDRLLFTSKERAFGRLMYGEEYNFLVLGNITTPTKTSPQ